MGWARGSSCWGVALGLISVASAFSVAPPSHSGFAGTAGGCAWLSQQQVRPLFPLAGLHRPRHEPGALAAPFRIPASTNGCCCFHPLLIAKTLLPAACCLPPPRLL